MPSTNLNSQIQNANPGKHVLHYIFRIIVIFFNVIILDHALLEIDTLHSPV